MARKKSSLSHGRRAKRKPKLETPFCKPCWELKYCPYGPLVEFFPLSPETSTLTQIRRIHQEVTDGFANGENRNEREVMHEVERFLYSEPSQWEFIKQFDTSELGCNVFGHICPVFITAEGATETKEGRRVSREIPRGVMLKVVRRDGQICQKCHEPVPDNEVEFDHIIPFSKGGPSTAENLRLVHRSCNRKKSNSLDDLLWRRDEP
jgi:hypothetical protein